MKTIISQSRKVNQWTTIGTIALSLLMALSSCRGKDRPTPPPPEPTPTPKPNPRPTEPTVAFTLTNGGVIREGKLTKEWQANDIVNVWGKTKEGQTNPSLSIKYGENEEWDLVGAIPKNWSDVTKASILYVPDTTYDLAKNTITPKMEVNKAIGDFTSSHYYVDILIGEKEIEKGKKIESTLNSPYQQVQLILQNGDYPQAIKNVQLSINGVLANATYTNDTWGGTPTTLKIIYKDKEWQANTADTLFFAIPYDTSTTLTATLSYTDEDNKSKTIEQLLPQKTSTPSTLLFSFPSTEISNPPLAFTLPNVDATYWKNANQKAMVLLMANRGEDYTEETARRDGWTISRPLTDELMHTKTIYTNDVNIMGWRVEQREEIIMRTRDWGLMFGLEDMNGNLVEVYPPLYFGTMGGYDSSAKAMSCGFRSNYSYITVPAGKYRIVCFVKWHKDYAGEQMAKKWRKLPLLDARTYDEIIRSNRDISLLYKPIPMNQSPYLGIDEVEVIDRVASHNVAPRWCMGMTYQSWEDFNNNCPSYFTSKASISRKIDKGTILQATMVNTSNQTLRGTIVAKCEYLPMFHPTVGKWRFEMFSYSRSKFTNQWSHEVGRTKALLKPNTETKAQVEITNFDWKWEFEGYCGTQELGPKIYIHLYWKDENGNETLMHRVDYKYMENAMRANFGDPITNHNATYEDNTWYQDLNWKEYKSGFGPADGWFVPDANGFKRC